MTNSYGITSHCWSENFSNTDTFIDMTDLNVLMGEKLFTVYLFCTRIEYNFYKIYIKFKIQSS